MAEWNRVDYDALESEGRWESAIISRNPAQGVSPGLIVYLASALAILAALTFAG